MSVPLWQHAAIAASRALKAVAASARAARDIQASSTFIALAETCTAITEAARASELASTEDSPDLKLRKAASNAVLMACSAAKARGKPPDRPSEVCDSGEVAMCNLAKHNWHVDMLDVPNSSIAKKIVRSGKAHRKWKRRQHCTSMDEAHGCESTAPSTTSASTQGDGQGWEVGAGARIPCKPLGLGAGSVPTPLSVPTGAARATLGSPDAMSEQTGAAVKTLDTEKAAESHPSLTTSTSEQTGAATRDI